MERLRLRLAERASRRLSFAEHRPAAVAVLLRDIAGHTHVTLTQRSPMLRAYSGQIAFPGGVRDPDDASPIATALRESKEEIGVDPAWVRILGLMDDEITSTGFIITPVVAELVALPRYMPNPAEVAQVFEAPVTAFSDPSIAEYLGERTVQGVHYRVRAYPYLEHRVQGITARILEQLSELISA